MQKAIFDYDSDEASLTKKVKKVDQKKTYAVPPSKNSYIDKQM